MFRNGLLCNKLTHHLNIQFSLHLYNYRLYRYHIRNTFFHLFSEVFLHDFQSIGGDYFGNYEGVLPKGKEYHECDIDTDGGYRGAKRIVFSDDGCIYYTEDHYETFELLYGEE